MEQNISFPSLDAPLAFDYQASTPCDEKVIESMAPYWNELYGNASSRQNRSGLQAGAAVSLAREKLLSCLGIDSGRFVFTSGATESNNLALIGSARARSNQLVNGGHIITLATEHLAVLDPLRQLQREGFRLTEIVPDSDGLIPISRLINAFEDDTFLVSIMTANNEIGVIQPISEIAKVCKEKGAIFHTDAVQAFGHIKLEYNPSQIDLISVSSHKLYGPKGIGGLFIRDGITLMPLHWGGGQEYGLRPGTLPVSLVVGFAKAAEISMKEINNNQKHTSYLRDYFCDSIKNKIPDIIINGSMKNRLPHNINFTVKGVSGSLLHTELRPFISCSSGSACSQGSPSHVLKAIGRTPRESQASLRISFGRNTNIKEVEKAIFIIHKTIIKLRGH